jgi:hypothetical protein
VVGRERWQGTTAVQDRVDLKPLFEQGAPAEILLLARGQLNRAFREHGLLPPDRLVPRNASGLTEQELDDPAAAGIEGAAARYGDAFWEWADSLPLILLRPILDILQQTRRLTAHGDDGGEAARAISAAYDYLARHLENVGTIQ